MDELLGKTREAKQGLEAAFRANKALLFLESMINLASVVEQLLEEEEEERRSIARSYQEYFERRRDLTEPKKDDGPSTSEIL